MNLIQRQYTGPMPSLTKLIPDLSDVVTRDQAERLEQAQQRFDELDSVIEANNFDAVRDAARDDQAGAAMEAADSGKPLPEFQPSKWLHDQAATTRKAAKVAQAEIARQINPALNRIFRKMAEVVSDRARQVIAEELVIWEPFGLDYQPSELVQALNALGERLVEESETEARHRSAAAPSRAFGLFGLDLWPEIKRDLFDPRPEWRNEPLTTPDIPPQDEDTDEDTEQPDPEDLLSGRMNNADTQN